MKKNNKAVALKYNMEEDVAPIVIASGYGHIAEKIVDVAEQTGIPVFRDDTTASLLCMLQVGENIPEDLYQIVAGVYKSIIEISGEIRGKTNVTKEEYRKERNKRLKIGNK